jgi:kynureninase
MTDPTDVSYARDLDAADELAIFRDRFVIDDPSLIYVDGNSLGRLPKATVGLLRELVDEGWGKRLIRGWGEGWFNLPETLGDKLSRLLGARQGEIIVADSTSVNLFKLIMAALRHRPRRTKIVTDSMNFPSDVYILQGILNIAGPQYQLQIVPSDDDVHGPFSGLANVIDEQTALVTLSHTVFKSGYVYDMAAMTRKAHQAGALVLWDLSHSAGAVPVNLNESEVDLAVGCTYKYLNGGPGSPAYLYIRRDLQRAMNNPISGWMGQKKPFAFDLDYEPATSLRHFLSGTPPVISLAAVEVGVDLVLEAGIDAIRAKSVRQGQYLIELWERSLKPHGFRLRSPREAAYRGSHISLGHEDGLRIDRALIEEMDVLPDFRAPDNIRLGYSPLYTSFVEIHEAVSRIVKVMEEKLYLKFPDEAPLVT